jgi:hypothetical protein
MKGGFTENKEHCRDHCGSIHAFHGYNRLRPEVERLAWERRWGMESAYQRMYNPATVETVSGTVENIDKVTPMKGMHSGIHVLLKTDKETISVHLGPDWYIERLDTKIEKGDAIEVKGSRVSFSGKPAMIAAEIKKGENVLVLRDNAGIPAWAGWRR